MDKSKVDGSIQVQAGVSIKLRTIWIIDKGEEVPRFVTAYPM
jgi:hypothetical protein